MDYAKLKQSSFSVSQSSAREELEEGKVTSVFDDEITGDEKENDEADYYRHKSEEKYGDIRTYTFSKSPSDYHNRYNREGDFYLLHTCESYLILGDLFYCTILPMLRDVLIMCRILHIYIHTYT